MVRKVRMVRMVRSLADRTFQLCRPWRAGTRWKRPGRPFEDPKTGIIFFHSMAFDTMYSQISCFPVPRSKRAASMSKKTLSEYQKLNSTQRKCYISYHLDKISKFERKPQVAAPRRVRSRMYQRENSAEDGESFSR